MYSFEPPKVMEGPIGDHRLFDFYQMPRGICLIKLNGEWYEDRYPMNEDLENAEDYYVGGNKYTVSDTKAAELTAAGYGSGLVGPL